MNSMVIGVLGVIFISTVAGWLFSRPKKVEKPVKVMLFVLYFWVSFFVQLVTFAMLYHFGILSDYF
ncbi:MAG: hypothetical protein GQ532_04950 [Methylomarinum sp.]|nr:hypothetical protein [Methylomarinum sp.]